MNDLALIAWQNPWILLAIPLVNALSQWFLVGRIEKGCGILATLIMSLTVIFAGLLLLGHQVLPPDVLASLATWQIPWLNLTDHFVISFGLLLDPLSLLLTGIVTLVSFLVQLYSLGYMKGEPGQARYFALLNLFTLSMLGLIVAPNLLQMFVFWELVGVSSFLLIGFYYQKPSARAAARKAFIVTRFADLGFLIGILILSYAGYQFSHLNAAATIAATSPLDFSQLTHPAFLNYLANVATPFGGMSLLTIALLALFMGGAGKSGQFPLHIWLPDAMEGPTPVSALIHAATMVVAGVYLVARLYSAYLFDGVALTYVGGIAAFTILFAAVIGCVQNDIKRVLAYSTLSQIGYMMLALAATSGTTLAGQEASLFHLFTHAFFKALLFLGAGSVIHGIGLNNLKLMGGLRKLLPVTHALVLIAVLAIAGFPPFAGFYSKDEILLAALHSAHPYYYYCALTGAGLTAFYMFRLYFLAFALKSRQVLLHHPHESWMMLTPMLVLAVGSIGAGFAPLKSFLTGEAGEAHGINWSVAGPALIMAIVGTGFAFVLFGRERPAQKALTGFWQSIHSLIENRFYIDEFYLFITRKIIFARIAAPIAWFDRHIVDGFMNLCGRATRLSGNKLGIAQTGQTQTYLAWIVLGLILAILFKW